MDATKNNNYQSTNNGQSNENNKISNNNKQIGSSNYVNVVPIQYQRRKYSQPIDYQ